MATFRYTVHLERTPCTIREFISSLSPSLVLSSRAVVVSRAATTGVTTPGWAHTAIRVYVPEVMGTFVRYFVVFLFLPGLYLRPDSRATNMRRDRLMRFVRRCTYVHLHLRLSVRPFVCTFAGPVRTFVRSVASFRGAFISTIICGGGCVVVIRYTTILPCVALREPRVMIMNSGLADGWFVFCFFFYTFFLKHFSFIDIFG